MGLVAPQRRAAFSLVELLVVLGIAVALLALLLTVLGGARAAATKAACANNLRQIGHGLIVYDQQYRRLPGSNGHKTLSDFPSFVDVLMDRQRYPAASFICPASGLDRPSSYDLNLDFVGQPLSKGRADTILVSRERVVCPMPRRVAQRRWARLDGQPPVLRRSRGGAAQIGRPSTSADQVLTARR